MSAATRQAAGGPGSLSSPEDGLPQHFRLPTAAALLITAALLTACSAAGPLQARTTRDPAPTVRPWPTAGSAGDDPTGAAPAASFTPAPTATPIILPTTGPGTPTATPLPTATPTPSVWQDWPVVPVVSQTARDIYRRGLIRGTDPRSFSVLGDSNSLLDYYLSVFDTPGEYRLGDEYAYLQPTIDNFITSFGRPRAAVGEGFNFASMFSGFLADPDLCQPGEAPLECEIRQANPSIIIIALGSNWMNVPTSVHEDYVRQVLDMIISRGIVPVVGTKADNLEGGHAINEMLVRVATEYDIPVWNFWRAVSDLPNHGLVEDGFHMTYARSYFDDPTRMAAAWPRRNLTALQALDAVWRAVTDQPPPPTPADPGGTR
jgi:hypothetical protein